MKISKSNSNWGGHKSEHVNSNRLGARADCVSYSHTNLQLLFLSVSLLFWFILFFSWTGFMKSRTSYNPFIQAVTRNDNYTIRTHVSYVTLGSGRSTKFNIYPIWAQVSSNFLCVLQNPFKFLYHQARIENRNAQMAWDFR